MSKFYYCLGLKMAMHRDYTKTLAWCPEPYASTVKRKKLQLEKAMFEEIEPAELADLHHALTSCNIR